MKLSYYPGCTLKTRARNFEAAAIISMEVLGYQLEEIPRWVCCGVVYSLAQDDLIHQLAPVRNLIRAMEQGSDRLITLCAMCYNTLARANHLVRTDPEKRKTINAFMDEEPDYEGQVEVSHLLPFLAHEVGWDRVRAMVKAPLEGLAVAPYYGCKMQRPREVAIEPPGSFELMHGFLDALGAEVVDFPAAALCCGSYQVLGDPEASQNLTATIIEQARKAGAQALAVSCPLCEFNLTQNQRALRKAGVIETEMPIHYFTQLLASSLGLAKEAAVFSAPPWPGQPEKMEA